MDRAVANKALLISENDGQLGQMRLLLERAGYTVLAADAGAAFDLTQGEAPDIIISEVGAQPRESIEICRRLRADAGLRATPILLIIDRRHQEQLAAQLQAEADDYIEAPFEALRLVTKVAQLIERRRTREAVGASQARLAGIVDSAMDAIITADGEQRILLFNAAAERMFRCPAAAALGQPLDRFIPARFRAQHSDHVRAFGQTGTTTRAMADTRAVYGLRADGQEFPIEASISQIEAGGQKIYTIIMRDISERQQAERASLHLAALVESSNDAIISKALDSTILSWNHGAERIFGYPAEEAIGRNITMLIPDNRLHEEPEILDRIRRGERIDHYETVRKRKDGIQINISETISPIKDGSGKIIAVSKIAREITEQKRTEAALRASEARFSIAFNASPISSVIATLDEGRYVAANDTFLSLTGYSRAEVIGNTSADLGIWPTPQARVEAIALLRRDGRIRNRETCYRMKGGEVRTFLTSAEIIEIDGKPHMITASIDITERKRADEALREQAQMLDLAPVLIRDLQARLMFWNTGAEQMYGWAEHEAIGQVSHDLLRTEFPQPLEEIRAAVFGAGHWEGELVRTRRDGGRIVVASHWVLHKNALGEPAAIVEINSDITERKHIEEEVRRLNEELEQRVAERTAQLQAANRELEAFSYSVSHDLRAPLRHINGFSQALLEDYADRLDDEGKGYLQEVRDASREMAQLIDDLLQLARVTRSEMRSETVSLSEVAHAVIADLRKRDAGRNVRVQIADGLMTHGDKRLLQIMLGNLLGNAWKFTARREQAEITFDQTRQAGEAVYFVRDNGAGFDMAYVNKLFGAFQRLHSGKEFEGTGIGLATVQRIVRRHGGRVWAEGQVNEGATFYFTLANFREHKHGEEGDLTG